MDYRLQGFLNDWLAARGFEGRYDRVALAGGVHDLTSVVRQVGIAVRLHRVQRVVLVNHENCGAYGSAGGADRHRKDLCKARDRIHKGFPHLEIELYFLLLDGTFQRIV
jgi:hypothetical protein